MSYMQAVRQVIKFKFGIFSLALWVAALALPTQHLEAEGCGDTGTKRTYEGTTWHGIYFDMNGLNLQGWLPNYTAAGIQNEIVSIQGEVGKETTYVIITSLNPEYKPPKSIAEFALRTQNANPDAIVRPLVPKKIGAKYALDLVPADPDNGTFWRFLVTNDRLIKMGTNDSNENRRLYFFENIFID